MENDRCLAMEAASNSLKENHLAPSESVTLDDLCAMVAQRRAEQGIVPRELPTCDWRFHVAPAATAEELALEAERIEHDRVRREIENRKHLWRRFLGESPCRYVSCTLTNFEHRLPAQEAAWRAATEYADSLKERRLASEGMLFYGPSGTGKDHLAIGILRVAIGDHGYSCERVNGSEWFGQIRDAMNDDSRVTEARLVERMCSPDFLLISDPLPPVGALSQHQATMLYRAVEARYFRGKPTFVTVNVASGDEATARMGAATWDRLKGGAWVIACNWPSFRQPARIVNGRS